MMEYISNLKLILMLNVSKFNQFQFVVIDSSP